MIGGMLVIFLKLLNQGVQQVVVPLRSGIRGETDRLQIRFRGGKSSVYHIYYTSEEGTNEREYNVDPHVLSVL